MLKIEVEEIVNKNNMIPNLKEIVVKATRLQMSLF